MAISTINIRPGYLDSPRDQSSKTSYKNIGSLKTMQKFKRNPLFLALVVAIGSAGIAGTTSAAVHLSDDGQGQVLIYPIIWL